MTTYASSGVNVIAGDTASRSASELAKQTLTNNFEQDQGVLNLNILRAIGDIPNPRLISSIDGVGTKLLLTEVLHIWRTVGFDLVGMNVNDLVRYGARPLFFLTYIGTPQIDQAKLFDLNSGIASACIEAGCGIAGGETAELPQTFQNGSFELVGSATGVVDKTKIITGSRIVPDDVLVALPSSGIHSNGYSLARKVLGTRLAEVPPEWNGKTIGDLLIEPTRLYVKQILDLINAGIDFHGIGHITGGGIPSKFGGIVPEGLSAQIDTQSWIRPLIFKLIQEGGQIELAEMFSTFNMGLGMVMAVSRDQLGYLRTINNEILEVGRVQTGKERIVINY